MGMGSVIVDLYVVAGLLAFLAFLLLGTAAINMNRKARLRWQKMTARLQSWK